MTTRLTAAVAAALLASCSPSPETIPETGEALLRDMHARHQDSAYRSLTFVQHSVFDDGREETWYETALPPGRLRIDVGPVDSMNTMVFRNDSMIVLQRGVPVQSRPLVHPLLLLAADVYHLPPERSAAKLRKLGFDLDRIRTDTWEGRPVYVVGAAAGDTLAPQFWVDRERLYTVRVIHYQGLGDSVGWTENRLSGHRRVGDGWIESEVVFIQRGKVVLHETYRDVRPNVEVDPALFETDVWQRPGWIPPGS